MVLEVRCEKGDARLKMKKQRLHHSTEFDIASPAPYGGETKNLPTVA